jgi:carbon-monoxide dehydrogenase medium subunit
MKPAAFEYHRPGTVEEALAALAELGHQGKVLAGGPAQGRDVRAIPPGS